MWEDTEVVREGQVVWGVWVGVWVVWGSYDFMVRKYLDLFQVNGASGD